MAATSDVADLEGRGICFGGSAAIGTGVICGGIQFDEDDHLWYSTCAISVYVGATLDTSTVLPTVELHGGYAMTWSVTVVAYDWLKPWAWWQ
jgi:hypothetical protein